MSVEEERGVVRVKVKKCEGALPVEFRSFAVDPQITSLEVLQHILIRAFELNGKRNFGISYLSRERGGVDVYVSLLSDWDLDAAFVSAAKPFLQLKMDIKPSEDSPVLEDWDIISPKDVIGSDQLQGEKKSLASTALPFTQSLLSQVGRTLSRVQQALTWSYGEEVKPFKPPLSDAEFHSYLNSLGQLTRPEELRLRIYHGGVEPSLRKVVWRYLLNVYPDGLTGQERMDYMKKKTREYYQLKSDWTARAGTEDLEFIRGNVLKDVLRTDRAHPYYSGSEDSPHLTSLTDLLTTFAITHPQVSYCQGMSDIASPILAVMDNEAHAFICFCGIMKRLEGNFRPDGQLMSVKFQHLKLLLQYSDPEFYGYLVSKSADDLFFCYRWLLLELKREFAFDDALRMLEVTWSSLPPDPPETEVELLGAPLEPEQSQNAVDSEQTKEQRRRHMLRPSREEADGDYNFTIKEEMGLRKECEGENCVDGSEIPPHGPYFEKQSSFGEFKYFGGHGEDSFEVNENDSSDPTLSPQFKSAQSSLPLSVRQSTEESEYDPGEQEPLITTHTTASPGQRDCPAGQVESPLATLPSGLLSWKSSSSQSLEVSNSACSWRTASPDALSKCSSSSSCADKPTSPDQFAASQSVVNGTVAQSPTVVLGKSLLASPTEVYSNSLLSSPVLSFGKSPSLTKPFSSNLPSPCKPTGSGFTSPIKPEGGRLKPCSLPPPQEFGKGNPFMLFLCLSILLEHRDHIIKNSLDYNELAMHFDRLVRRHNLGRILQRAKALFADYLQSEVWDSEEGDEVSLDSPITAATSPQTPSSRPPFLNVQPYQGAFPNSTYNLTNTIPSPTSPIPVSPSVS
ncbi:hypothetical protein DNTS_011700 [Danionella cerebrum]|uniref:Rab-GAP TBC domain-containing protein n=1 Tax=Danionella cerebrum TaxID=2873325 RepID=A0A553QU47_9TELE|nr:hypothetical protein DNTS_011700 [Danionella translucida]